MNKKILYVLALILAIFLVMGAANAGWFDFGSDDSTSNITNNDTVFIVGFDAEFPPYGYTDENGSYVGFDLDLAQEVCRRNNWTFVPQPIDWDSKDAELNSGTIDCIWNGFTINGRENDYLWSDPYIDNKQVIVVKADSGITSLEDLANKTVETQKDSSAAESLGGDNKSLADTFKDLVEVADYNTAFMDLQSGACDAVAMDIGVAQYQISQSDNPDGYIILDEPISSEQYGIGFKLGNEELRDQVQKTLDEMFADGTVAEIAEKYSEFGVPGSLITK